MKLTVSKKAVSDTKGMLYVLAIHLEGKELIKVGITQRPKIEDRVSEILVGIFKKYRVFPYCKPKKFTTVDEVFKKEAEMHKYLDQYRYKTEHVFGGSTEFFHVELDVVLDAYERLLKGEDINASEL